MLLSAVIEEKAIISRSELAHAIGAGLVIPCHYDLFEFNTASPAHFVAACDRLGQPHRLLQVGERMELTR